jgi:hypothetical protein
LLHTPINLFLNTVFVVLCKKFSERLASEGTVPVQHAQVREEGGSSAAIIGRGGEGTISEYFEFKAGTHCT